MKNTSVLWHRRRLFPWAFLLPSLTGTCLFYLTPLLEIVVWSFFDARRSNFVLLWEGVSCSITASVCLSIGLCLLPMEGHQE